MITFTHDQAKTLVVLCLFCCVMVLQAACAAGVLSHCDHPDQPYHHQDVCPEDHCRDDYALPLKFDPQPQAHQGQSLTLASGVAERLADIPCALPEDPGISPVAACPSGPFPLLI